MNLPRRHRSSTCCAESGFSMIEVMQTLALMSVGLLGLSSLTLGIIRGNASAQRITSAAVIAQDKIEELRNVGFAGIAGGQDQVTVTGIVYARNWTVSPNHPVTGAAEVTVEVGWFDQPDKTVTLQTIISR